MTELADDTQVEGSIRRWHETQRKCDEALRQCRRAEDEATRLRGENDALVRQKIRDEQELKQLRTQLAEIDAHITGAASIFLDLIEKRKAAQYRAPGSRLLRVHDIADRAGAAAAATVVASDQPAALLAQFASEGKGAPTGEQTEAAVIDEAEHAVAELGAKLGADNRPPEWDESDRRVPNRR